jgi:subtilisin family serine protease
MHIRTAIGSVFFALLSTSAYGLEIYELPAHVQINSFAATELSAQIVDSIPQLGIVITKSKLKSGLLKNLGSVRRVQLIEPLEAPQLPKALWGMKAIGVQDAWKYSTGEGVVVAVSDTGIDLDHPDLEANIWTNPGEIAGNGIDDDHNGYVDDVHGWDFVSNQPAHKDHHFHGTHVAGTIAAKLSDRIVGVAPGAKLMSVPFIDSSGSGDDAAGAKTLVYAADNGARVVNCSWGGLGRSVIIEKAIEYARSKGLLVVAAAGNNGVDTDRRPFFPAGIESDNIISVGATAAKNGVRADFSNFGKASVDIAAPGAQIKSTSPSDSTPEYRTLDGTSMATPHVVGAAALVAGAHAGSPLTYLQIKNILLQTASPNRFWKKTSVSGGVLNAAGAAAKAASLRE